MRERKSTYNPDLHKGSPWSDHWRDDLFDLGTEGHHILQRINSKNPEYLKHRIWALGDLQVMEEPFIVAFSGRNFKCPKEEIEIGKQIIVRMSQMGLIPIHGNEKGTERGAARRLREHGGKQILVPHYGLVQFKNRFRERTANAVDRGNVLVLSPFNVYEPWRPKNLERRNMFIADMADAMIAVQVTDENSGGHLARQMLDRGKPVFLTEAAGRAQYCVDDHEFMKRLGAKEFKLSQLDYVINKIKEGLGYR